MYYYQLYQNINISILECKYNGVSINKAGLYDINISILECKSGQPVTHLADIAY